MKIICQRIHSIYTLNIPLLTPTPTPTPTPAPVVVIIEEPVLIPLVATPPEILLTPVEPEDVIPEIVTIEEEEVPLSLIPELKALAEPEEQPLEQEEIEVEVINEEPEVEVTIIDEEETPLAVLEEDCFIHWIILLLTLVFGIYETIRIRVRSKRIQELKNHLEVEEWSAYENENN